MAKVLSEEDKQFIRETTLVYGMIGQLYKRAGSDKTELEYANQCTRRIGACQALQEVLEIKSEIETKLLS